MDRISIFNKIDIKNKLSIATRFVYEDRWGGEINWNKSYRGGDLDGMIRNSALAQPTNLLYCSQWYSPLQTTSVGTYPVPHPS